MKKIITIIGLFLIIASVNAQSPVGKWKLVDGKIETITGKRIEFLKEDYEKEPCLANVVYTFSADGKIITKADNCADSTRKSLEASNLAIKWESSGNKKIIVSTKDKDIDPVTYDFEVFILPHLNNGKRVMNWELKFDNDPEDRNPERARRLYFVYYAL